MFKTDVSKNFKKAVFSRYQVYAVTKLQKVSIDTINDDPCEEVDWDDGKEDCMDGNGDTAYFFEKPKPLPKGTWLLQQDLLRCPGQFRQGVVPRRRQSKWLQESGGKTDEGCLPPQ